MATYFDFEKKHPHINCDDVYVKHGEVKEDKLVLEYSVEGLDPLSISLSAFDKMATYINDAEFKDNNLILKHNYPIADLSINLSSLDKHVTEVKKADDSSALSLCFNDGTFLSVDTAKFAEDNQVISCYVDGNNLVLERNNSKAPLIADLDKFNTHIASWEVVGNDLILRYNDQTPALSVALDRFHKHISKAELDNCDQLTLSYVDDVAAPLSIDLSKYSRNYYVNEAALCGDIIVLRRNSADAGEDLSVDASSLNNYIQTASIDGKTLVLSYNSDRLQPLSIDITDFIKDYYIADAKLCADSKLHLKYNKSELDDIIVDLSPLDDKIIDIKQENDTIQFHRTIGTLPIVNLSKYVNNNLSTMHVHGNSLVLKFDDDRTKDVSLDKFDKYVNGYHIDDGTLKFTYKNSTEHLDIQLSDIGREVISGTIGEDANSLNLQFSNGKEPLAISTTKLNVHLSSAEVVDSNLKLGLTNHDPITTDLSKFANEIVDAYVFGSFLKLKFANGKERDIDLTMFNKFIQQMSFNGNSLVLTYNDFSILTADLDKFDKYIANASVENGNIVAKYNNDKGEAFKIPLDDINYELTSGTVDDDCQLSLKFTNGKVDVVIDASNLKSPDTYISSIVLDNKDNLVFDYNRANVIAKAVSLHKFARNDYVANGRYDSNAEKLILDYNNQEGFQTKLPALSIDIPRGSGKSEDYHNALSGMSFIASDEKSILSIAQAIEQIVTAFGGNRQN